MIRDDARPVLITGGAGFIGANLAQRLLDARTKVVLFDNFSRAGVQRNADWLRERYGSLVEVQIGDVRDAAAVKAAVSRASRVYHFAAQVAVTSSLRDPSYDFDVNARGTLHVLEAIRACTEREPPPLLVTSTNKVYGALDGVELDARPLRWEPADPEIRGRGVSEARPLDPSTPYGCSKGAADHYTLDYARTFGLPATVLRMSCVYGPRQLGTEDQGWLAHLLLAAMRDEPIVVYGDGRQVRDALYVGDLVDAMVAVSRHQERARGRAFNVGGGAENTVSVLELVDMIGELRNAVPPLRFESWRRGDQRWYVSDTRAFAALTGWAARTSLHDGLRKLHAWLAEIAGRPTIRSARLESRP